MKKILFPQIIDSNNNRRVVVLGKFESMHIAHMKLIEEGRKIADNFNSDLIVMMFSEKENNNIYSLEERVMFAKKFNPNYILEFTPNKDNFNNSWEEFNSYLKENNVIKVVCGKDFKYGKNREGNIETLKKNFDVYEIEEIKIKNEPIKTSAIISCLKNDDLIKFKDMMNHYFFYKGKVVKGKGNGKKFNMPTANVEYPKYKIGINEGIYYSFLIHNGKRMPSLTSISKNPTLGENEVTYETYIFNFDKDIYYEDVYVELIEKYRNPIKFESINKLIEALKEDKKLGKKYFNLR